MWEIYIDVPDLSLFSRDRQYGVVAKIIDTEFAVPAPKLTSCGSLEKLLIYVAVSPSVR